MADVVLKLKPPFLDYDRSVEVPVELGEGVSRFYTITLPTGAGKTLNALRVVDGLIKRFGIRPTRVIYTLPYVSLVSQTERVYKNVLSEDWVASLSYLTGFDLDALASEGDIAKVDRYKSAVDAPAFGYPVVVTTFVRLWSMLLPPSGTSYLERRFLFRSVVILDEIQAFPLEYWEDVKELMKFFAKRYGTIFILMTATMPTMFRNIDGAIELVPPSAVDRGVLADYYSRRSYVFDEKVYESLDELASRVNGHDSILVVVNTRDKAYKLGAKLGWPVLTSSTPKRLREIMLSHVRKGRIRRLVSTQTIEAGADVNFDTVYRELAPMDSIIQSGGRCNRQGLRDKDYKVYVFRTEDTPQKVRQVYGSKHAEILSEVFSELWGSELSEKELYEKLPEVESKILNVTASRKSHRKLLLGLFSKFSTEGLIKDEKRIYVITPEMWERLKPFVENQTMPSNLADVVLFGDEAKDVKSFSSPSKFARALLWQLPVFAFSVRLGGLKEYGVSPDLPEYPAFDAVREMLRVVDPSLLPSDDYRHIMLSQNHRV